MDILSALLYFPRRLKGTDPIFVFLCPGTKFKHLLFSGQYLEHGVRYVHKKNMLLQIITK